MLGNSHAPLILDYTLTLALSIPSAALKPRVSISPLPFCFTPALTFSLASSQDLIRYIPSASNLALDLISDLDICVISSASAPPLAFAISKASVLALVSVETLFLSAFPLISASALAPYTFYLISSLALAPNLT